MKIELKSYDINSDWEQLILNGELFSEGHSIPDFEWLALIKEITGAEVSSEFVELGDYEEPETFPRYQRSNAS